MYIYKINTSDKYIQIDRYIYKMLVSYLTAAAAVLFTAVSALNMEDVPPKPEDGELWAVLVAGSNGWSNYRHQADVCHAYQVGIFI